MTSLASGHIGDAMAVNAGRVSEYDEPKRLLEDKSSFFASLVAEYATRSSAGSV